MKHSRSSLFLMELILAILFFSIASAVCIQLFAKSHTLSKRTINQNNALIQTQNLAEGFLATDGNLENIADLFPMSALNPADGSVTLYFDNNWKTVTKDSATFIAVLQKTGSNSDDLITADISVTDCSNANDTLYSLQVQKHIAVEKQ